MTGRTYLPIRLWNVMIVFKLGFAVQTILWRMGCSNVLPPIFKNIVPEFVTSELNFFMTFTADVGRQPEKKGLPVIKVCGTSTTFHLITLWLMPLVAWDRWCDIWSGTHPARVNEGNSNPACGNLQQHKAGWNMPRFPCRL